jgi:hypothetical protein
MLIDSPNDHTLLRKLMSIVDCTSTASTEDAVSDVGINERLRAIADSMISFNTTNNGEVIGSTLAGTEACHWFVSPLLFLCSSR